MTNGTTLFLVGYLKECTHSFKFGNLCATCGFEFDDYKNKHDLEFDIDNLLDPMNETQTDNIDIFNTDLDQEHSDFDPETDLNIDAKNNIADVAEGDNVNLNMNIDASRKNPEKLRKNMFLNNKYVKYYLFNFETSQVVSSKMISDNTRNLIESKKLNIVFDLDNTLILYCDQYNETIANDKINFQDRTVIYFRKYLLKFMFYIKDLYNIYVFTMGEQTYAHHIVQGITLQMLDKHTDWRPTTYKKTINNFEYTYCPELIGERIISRTEVLQIHKNLTIHQIKKNLHYIYPLNVHLTLVVDDKLDIWEDKPEGGTYLHINFLDLNCLEYDDNLIPLAYYLDRIHKQFWFNYKYDLLNKSEVSLDKYVDKCFSKYIVQYPHAARVKTLNNVCSDDRILIVPESNIAPYLNDSNYLLLVNNPESYKEFNNVFDVSRAYIFNYYLDEHTVINLLKLEHSKMVQELKKLFEGMFLELFDSDDVDLNTDVHKHKPNDRTDDDEIMLSDAED